MMMMKSITFFVLLILAAVMAKDGSKPVLGTNVASQSARKLGTNVASQNARKLQEKVDGFWPVGTPVYHIFDGEWWQGTITNVDITSSVYTVTWSDGTVEVDEWNLDAIDRMVENFKNEFGGNAKWDVGTGVYKNFDGTWYEGSITGYDGVYTISWDDGSVDVDKWDNEAITQMVADYEDYFIDVYDVGTLVYQESDGVGYQGTITAYDPQIGYTITWSDGEVEVDEYSDEDMDDMVGAMELVDKYKTGGNGDHWEIGTSVFMVYQGDFYDGTITDYNDEKGFYTLTWSDGSVDVGTWSNAAVDQMVRDARNRAPTADLAEKPENLSGVLIAFIVIVVLCLTAFIAAWGIRQNKRKQSGKEDLGDLNLQRYSDQPAPDVI